MRGEVGSGSGYGGVDIDSGSGGGGRCGDVGCFHEPRGVLSELMNFFFPMERRVASG